MNIGMCNHQKYLPKIDDHTTKTMQRTESAYPSTDEDLFNRQNQNEILYIYMQNNHYYAVTTKGRITVQLNSFYKLTELSMFIQVNRNYLVNLHHVLHIHKKTHEITMSNQDIIEISKRKWSKFLFGFMQELS